MNKLKIVKVLSIVAIALISESTIIVNAAEHLLVGVQAPITGEYANEGQGIANGTEIVIEQINSKGGLLGRKLTMTVCDDQGTAAGAAICARQLVDKGVFAVIGTYTSGAALAAQPIYARANVIQTSDGTADELTQKGYKTFFRNSPPNDAEATSTALFLKDQGIKSIAIITDQSSFATGLAKGVDKEAKVAEIKVLAHETIKANSQDYNAVLTKINALNPDVVYFSGYYTDGGLIKAQMRQLGMKAKFVGGDANYNVQFAKLAGKAASGAIIISLPAPKDLSNPAAKEFVKQYVAKFKNEPPSVFTLTNPDGLRAIAYTAEQIKSIEPDKLIPALHKLKDFDGITGVFSWDDKGERLGNAFYAYEITDSGDTVVWPK